MNPITEQDSAAPKTGATRIAAPASLPPLVPDLDADPFDGIPARLLDLVGSYDLDTAGGCG